MIPMNFSDSGGQYFNVDPRIFDYFGWGTDFGGANGMQFGGTQGDFLNQLRDAGLPTGAWAYNPITGQWGGQGDIGGYWGSTVAGTPQDQADWWTGKDPRIQEMWAGQAPQGMLVGGSEWESRAGTQTPPSPGSNNWTPTEEPYFPNDPWDPAGPGPGGPINPYPGDPTDPGPSDPGGGGGGDTPSPGEDGGGGGGGAGSGGWQPPDFGGAYDVPNQPSIWGDVEQRLGDLLSWPSVTPHGSGIDAYYGLLQGVPLGQDPATYSDPFRIANAGQNLFGNVLTGNAGVPFGIAQGAQAAQGYGTQANVQEAMDWLLRTGLPGQTQLQGDYNPQTGQYQGGLIGDMFGAVPALQDQSNMWGNMLGQQGLAANQQLMGQNLGQFGGVQDAAIGSAYGMGGGLGFNNQLAAQAGVPFGGLMNQAVQQTQNFGLNPINQTAGLGRDYEIFGRQGLRAFNQDPNTQSVGTPGIQSPIEQTLTEQIQTGGLTGDYIDAMRRQVFEPGMENLFGQLQQMGGGYGDLTSGLPAELQRRAERDFQDTLIRTGFGGMQTALGQGMGLGGQQFGQGMANQQLGLQDFGAMLQAQGLGAGMQQAGLGGQLGAAGQQYGMEQGRQQAMQGLAGQSFGQGMQGIGQGFGIEAGRQGAFGNLAQNIYGQAANDIGQGYGMEQGIGQNWQNLLGQQFGMGMQGMGQVGGMGMDVINQAANLSRQPMMDQYQMMFANRGQDIQALAPWQQNTQMMADMYFGNLGNAQNYQQMLYANQNAMLDRQLQADALEAGYPSAMDYAMGGLFSMLGQMGGMGGGGGGGYGGGFSWPGWGHGGWGGVNW